MYLDQRGMVRACCQNAAHPLGSITERPLLEIWRGARAEELREAVAVGDLRLGCDFCAWQRDEGADATSFARTFDHLPAAGVSPPWPRQLELSLSNACNLQCVMCNGEWSSSIRTHREHLPPLPKVYTDRFFEELAEFLPHLQVVKFLGGEPFLGAESLRVMEMIAAMAPAVEVHVTTNGTQWSDRIERILRRLRVHVVVSLDGVNAATYEAIRIGSQLDDVLDNVQRFADHCRRSSTTFSLSHCLMTQNCSEFREFLELAERIDCSVFVNTVTEPNELSLYHLAPSELRRVVADLEAQDAAAQVGLSGVRQRVWSDQLDRLRHHLDRLESHSPPDYVAQRRHLGFAWLAPPERASRAASELDDSLEHTSAWVLDVDELGRLSGRRPVGEPSVGLGEAVAEAATLGSDLLAPLGHWDRGGGVDRHDLRSHRARLPGATEPVDVVVTTVAVRDGDGVVVGATVAVEEVRAFHLAASLADGAHRMAGYVVGGSGLLESLDGAVGEVLGVSADAAPRDLRSLERAVQDALGPIDGDDVDHGVADGIPHVIRRHRDGSGRVTVLHLFSEPTGTSTRVWVVRQPERPSNPVDPASAVRYSGDHTAGGG
jgi:molybdenum cofactor biosynthesis enzyme MoaA